MVAGQDADHAALELAGALRFVARQPILDLHGRVHAYELLFRSGRETIFRGDGDFATHTMIDNTVMFGLDKLTGGLPAFINCTSESLINEEVAVLPSKTTVLEVLETVEPTPEVIAACRQLKAQGFLLALDDFIWREDLEPLIELADYIKVDFLVSGVRERGEMLARLRTRRVALLAEKVESHEDYLRARGEGFTLFQGYYFCHPTLLTHRKVPANNLFHIDLLRALQQTPLDLARTSELVKRDASLTYRLLRLVNSAVCAMRQEVHSIPAALMAVGDNAFRRIATLAIASELNSGQPAEILKMALVRARFCELGSDCCGLDALEQYLIGMFSLMPAMLHIPMEEILAGLPLSSQVHGALLGAERRERVLLTWVEAYERGDWRLCDALALKHGIDAVELHRYWRDALVWADTTLSVAAPDGRPGAKGKDC
jgi:EAL and modified HD-GYP domain-containing signal transduction protein